MVILELESIISILIRPICAIWEIRRSKVGDGEREKERKTEKGREKAREKKKERVRGREREKTIKEGEEGKE